MRIRTLAILAASLAICLSASAQANSSNFDGHSWWDHVKVLADDNMEGRDTGSPGLQRAEAYVIDYLKNNGIQPAGANGFYQPIQFVSRQLDESKSSLSLVRDGKEEKLVLGDDAILSTRVDPVPKVDAGLVFAGYGLRIPENNIDDFAGLDTKGKILVVFSGSPAELSAALSAHYQSTAQRAKVMQETGAIGYLIIPNPAAMDIPWERIKTSRLHPSMGYAETSLNETGPAQIGIFFNPASAEKLFEGSGHRFDQIAALGKERKPLPHFPLTAQVRATQTVIRKQLESSNVVGKLVGSDSKLRDEYVVLSAHIDHLGIGEPIDGDRIYNGAMDNGSGSALLMDMASALPKLKPKRSVLFVFVTGEEKGLLGSHYFALHPTVPVKSMVADINTDMFLPICPLKLLTVYGLAESDLGDDVEQVAKQDGVTVQPDQEPQRNLFIRSDQYSFIRDGIPSLAMKVGFEKGSPEEKMNQQWLHDRYHAPSDDLNQPVDLAAAGKYEDIIRDLVMKVADDPRRPEWKPDSFFRRFADQQNQRQ
ncbi:MAG: M28 family metallopeptidase [Terriglobales bacterium]